MQPPIYIISFLWYTIKICYFIEKWDAFIIQKLNKTLFSSKKILTQNMFIEENRIMKAILNGKRENLWNLVI